MRELFDPGYFISLRCGKGLAVKFVLLDYRITRSTGGILDI